MQISSNPYMKIFILENKLPYGMTLIFYNASFIIVIVSCTNIMVSPSHLNIVLFVGMGINSNPSVIALTYVS